MLREVLVRVLVLDSQAQSRAIVNRALSSEGCLITAVRSCGECRTTAGSFDVGIFDIELPDGLGIDVVRELVARGRLGRAIFFTSHVQPELLDRALSLGVVVGKNEHVEVLRRAVRRCRTDH